MKKLIYIAFAVITLAAVSCQMNPEFELPGSPDQQGLVLRFSSRPLSTKAEVAGIDNENLIKQIDYFFFPLNADGEVDDEAKYVYKGQLIPEDGGLAGTYEKTFDTGVLAEIFPNGNTKAMVFAIANYVDKFGDNNDIEEPNTTLPEDADTWAELHALEVGPTFFYDDGDEDFLLRWPHVLTPDADDLFFVMTGEEVVELASGSGYAVDATIPLKRLASKITVEFTYENYPETSKNILWVPQPSGEETRVYLSNAIEHTTLGGPLTRSLVEDSWDTATMPLGDGSRDIFEYAYNFMNQIPETDGKKIAHFYTYPIQMENGDDNQTHLKLVLPWYGYKWRGEGSMPTEMTEANKNNFVLYKQTEVYYKIALPDSTINQSNRIYQYSVKVNTIGSDKDVEITGYEYIVKDWLTNEGISSNVATGRYISLDIPKNEYDMYVDDVEIAFVSSGTVIPIVKEIYQWNFSGNTPTKDYFMQDGEVVASNPLRDKKEIARGASGDNFIKSWVTIPNETSKLKISHEMCNDIEVDPISKFDAAPYVFVVTLHLEAEGTGTSSFDRTVTITQYPALYVEAETNSAYPNNNYGYVYVNGEQNTTTTSWYRVSGLGGNNSNPNMFVITSTILTDPDMLLGDPRKQSIQNGYSSNDNSWSPTASSIHQSGTRQLTYYHPTDNSEEAKKVVSPKFRIASSYGKTQPVNRQNAFQRCASYQEDGYPAGRWRIPTNSEVKHVVNLSANGFIDILFGSDDGDTNYWTASGYITVNNESNTVTPHDGDASGYVYVRCVYDDWYWGDEKAQDKEGFIWGD